jgi:hypothetical protein
MSSGATLVAGVGVLLLAIGLGVLIGHYGKNPATPKASATPPVTIVQPGGGGGANTAAAATAPTTTPTPTVAPTHVRGVTKKAQVKEKAAATSKTVQKKAVQAAGKVLGNSNNLASPTATTGSSCTSNQAGCQNGRFTGNFFGP